MGLFKDKQKPLPALDLDDEPANYNTALEYLLGLSDKDYETITKVAAIHRQANKDAAEILGLPDDPVTFIHPPQPELVDTLGHTVSTPSTMLDEDDDLSQAFLEDEPKAKKAKAGSSRSIRVKD